MERSVVPLRKLPRVQQLLGQTLPLENQKSTDEQARDRESFALERKQKGHWSPTMNRSSPASVNNEGWAVGTGQGATSQA